MKTQTDIRAGALSTNHNETLVCDTSDSRRSLKVSTDVRAGALTSNHNETLVRARRLASTPTRK